ncbi:MAG: transposase, partial [Butyrivibrio sp.]|nr:transposase [Butyrivibrio sp.]
MKSIKVAVTTWDKTETASTSFAEAIKELGFARALKGANIRRTPRNRDGKDDAEKRSAYCMFLHFLMVIFHADNFFQFLGTKRADEAAAKSTSYRFLEDKSFNWRKLVALVAVNAIKLISGLTSNIRIKCFILDDSVISRSRAKMVELLSYIYDHVIGKTVKGFNLLLLGWTDGYSFIPILFNMMASSKPVLKEEERNARQKARESIDKRTNGYKARKDAKLKKTDAAIKMLEYALSMGITASYVLMDTWFTTEPFVKRINDLGLDVIGMLKDCKQQYFYNDRLYGL